MATFSPDEVKIDYTKFQTKKKNRKQDDELIKKKKILIDKILELVFNSFEVGHLAEKRLDIFGYEFSVGFFDYQKNPYRFQNHDIINLVQPDVKFKKEFIEILYFGSILYLGDYLERQHKSEEDLLRLQQSLFSLM